MYSNDIDLIGVKLFKSILSIDSYSLLIINIESYVMTYLYHNIVYTNIDQTLVNS